MCVLRGGSDKFRSEYIYVGVRSRLSSAVDSKTLKPLIKTNPPQMVPQIMQKLLPDTTSVSRHLSFSAGAK